MVDGISSASIARRCVIIGGGLAGLAAAAKLAKCGRHVVLLESRQRLGRRASSFVDAESGDTIDNCQHVAMGCCQEFLEFSRELGFSDLFARQESLLFLAKGHAPCRFRSNWLPAPLHLAGAFAKLPYLTWSEKLAFAQGVRQLWSTPAQQLRGQSFATWLAQHRQPERVIKRAWEVLLISALSESLERIDAAYARKVLVDGFLESCHGWEVFVPQVPLDDIYTARIIPALQNRGVDIRLNQNVVGITSNSCGIQAVKTRHGEQIEADEFVVAVPWHRVTDMLGLELMQKLNWSDIGSIESAPISSVHLWTDAAFTPEPHVVLVDSLCQWLFRLPQAETAQGVRYQVVISASRMLQNWDQATVIDNVWRELGEFFPPARTIPLRHARVVTEHRSVFSPLPGIDRLRPAQATVIPNLAIAGDWTATGWPATMEGAVRSGLLAAEALLNRSKE